VLSSKEVIEENLKVLTNRKRLLEREEHREKERRKRSKKKESKRKRKRNYGCLLWVDKDEKETFSST
jgi:hypothetical protein